MEDKKKKKLKIKKNFVIGLILILISLNRIFHYIGISISNIALGSLLILTGILMFSPFLFPNFFKKFKDSEQEKQEKPKPEVYFYSKPQQGDKQINSKEQLQK